MTELKMEQKYMVNRRREKGLSLGALTAILVVLLLVGVVAFRAYWVKAEMPVINYHLLDGTTLTHDELNGKVVVVYLWATSCSTCVESMPELAKMYQRFHKRGLELIAVAGEWDDLDELQDFYHRRQLPFSVTYDADGEIFKQWGDVGYTPMVYVVNREGKLFKSLHTLEEQDLLPQIVQQLI